MTITRQEVADNYPLSPKDADLYAHRTISSQAFYPIVMARVKAKTSLSVVRMGDGERTLFIDAATAAANRQDGNLIDGYDLEWRTRMGIEGLTFHELESRMTLAIRDAEYYSPNVNGLMRPDFSLYPWYKMVGSNQPLVDNFFVNTWTLEEKVALLKLAGNVLVLHANPVTATTFAKRARAYLNVGIRHISLKSWGDGVSALAECAKWDYPLVLVSAGPASKCLIPSIARQGKVVLDLGNAMDHWLLYELYAADPAKMVSK